MALTKVRTTTTTAPVNMQWQEFAIIRTTSASTARSPNMTAGTQDALPGTSSTHKVIIKLGLKVKHGHLAPGLRKPLT